MLVINDLDRAAPLACALFDGGLGVLEVTLRTPVALEAARAMKAAIPEAIVGLGTICTPNDLDKTVDADLDFGVSPGISAALLDRLGQGALPFLPGAATVSEIMTLREADFRDQKFFPAELNGGAAFLKAVHSILPDVGVCPTGGMSPANASDYLELPNVISVGGSWVAPPSLIADGNWTEIENRAREAVGLKTPAI